MATEKYRTVGVMLAPDQIEALDVVAQEKRLSRSDIVRDLLDRGLRDLRKEERQRDIMRQLDERNPVAV